MQTDDGVIVDTNLCPETPGDLNESLVLGLEFSEPLLGGLEFGAIKRIEFSEPLLGGLEFMYLFHVVEDVDAMQFLFVAYEVEAIVPRRGTCAYRTAICAGQYRDEVLR